MALFIAILAVLFIILILVVWLSFVVRFICYFISDYLHYKLYGEVLFQADTTRNFLLLTSHLDEEYKQIKRGLKARDHSLYRVGFMVYYYSTVFMRFTLLPFIVVAVLFFVLVFIYEDMFM